MNFLTRFSSRKYYRMLWKITLISSMRIWLILICNCSLNDEWPLADKLTTTTLSSTTASYTVGFDRFKITISTCKRIRFACGLYTNSRILTESTGTALQWLSSFVSIRCLTVIADILDHFRLSRSYLVENSTKWKKLCCTVS